MGERAEKLGKVYKIKPNSIFLADPKLLEFWYGAAAVTVPASALAAGLGGVAAGKA